MENPVSFLRLRNRRTWSESHLHLPELRLLLSGTYQMETQTSSVNMQVEVMEQPDAQVPVPLQSEASRSQNLQSWFMG